MRKIEIEIPEGKKAEWVNGVLTLVDEPEKPHEFKVGDKAILKNDTGFSQRNGVCLISAGTQVEIMSVSNCINDTDKLYEVKYQNATTVVKRGDIIPIEQKSIEYKFKVGDKVTDSYYQDTIYEIVDLKEYDGEPLYVLKLNDAVFIALERCIKLVPQDIAERIKTFDDAEDWCSQNKPELCRQWRDYCNAEDDDVEAYLKLRIITAALNEGWEPTKEDPGWMPRWLESKYCNLGVATCRDYLGNYAFKLGLKSIELALYAKEQFSDIYADFCGGKKGGEG